MTRCMPLSGPVTYPRATDSELRWIPQQQQDYWASDAAAKLLEEARSSRSCRSAPLAQYRRTAVQHMICNRYQHSFCNVLARSYPAPCL